MAKRKCKELNIKGKIEVLEFLEGNSQRKSAANFGVSKTTVNNIKKRKDEYLSLTEGNTNFCRKQKSTKNEEINNATVLWFKKMRANNNRVSGPMIQEAALKFAEKFGLHDFKASSVWLEKFKLRNEISQKVLSGDSNEVSEEVVKDFQSNFSNFIEVYGLRDVFNADECGLFYRALPDKSLVMKGDPCKSGKMSKERLTVLLAANTSGEKLTPLVIGKSKSPRAFKSLNKKDLPVMWYSNKRAWMTSDIFEAWLQIVNKDMKRQKRKILMIVDNCPAHPKVQELSNIKVKFLPPNATSVLQPLDQGVIKNFKTFYRKLLLESVISRSFGEPPYEIKSSVNVLDAVLWIDAAWRKVEEKTIERCFRKAGFGVKSSDDLQSLEPDVETVLLSLPDFTFDKEVFVCFDNALSTYADVCLETIFNDVMEEKGTNEADTIPSDEESESAQECQETLPNIEDVQRNLTEIKNFALKKCPRLLCDVNNVESTLNEYICCNLRTLKQQKISQYFTKAHYKA